MKAWLRGNVNDIKKFGWVDGRMGFNNVNKWLEK